MTRKNKYSPRSDRLAIDQRVYVADENSQGTVTEDDGYSVFVRLDIDGVVVSCAFEQCEII